jgi:hypothetical protein
MAKVNRYYQQGQAPYVSQYADYKLPYEAIQNAVLGRQGTFDKNQAMLGNAANKYGQVSKRAIDAEGVSNKIDSYLEDVNNTVDNKYNGDFSLAAGDIYDKTSRFTSDPFWASVENAYQQEQGFQDQKLAAQAAGREVYEFQGSGRETSVFGEDGTTKPVNYNQEILRSATENRTEREQYFNNKKLNSWGSGAKDIVKELNKTAGMSDDEFVAWQTEKGISFSNEYVDGAVEEYVGSRPQEYRILLDSKNQKTGENYTEDEAKLIIKRRMANTSEEFKQYQRDINVKTTRAPVKGEIGDDDPSSPMDLLSVKPTDNTLLGKGLDGEQIETPANRADINAIVNNPNTTPENKRMAEIISNDAHLAATDPSTPAGQRAAEAHDSFYGMVDTPEHKSLVGKLAYRIGENVVGNPSDQTQELLEAVVGGMLDPNNQGPGYWDTLGESLGIEAGNIAAGVKNMVKGMVQANTGVTLEFESFKDVDEVQAKYLTSFQNMDPDKAAQHLQNFLSMSPGTLKSILGEDAELSGNATDANPFNNNLNLGKTFAGDIERLSNNYNEERDNFQRNYTLNYNANLTKAHSIRGDEVFLSALKESDFKEIESLLPVQMSRFLPKGVPDGMSEKGYKDLRSLMEQPLGNLQESIIVRTDPVSGNAQLYVDPALYGYEDDIADIKLDLDGYKDGSKQDAQDYINGIFKMDGISLYNKEIKAKESAETFVIKGIDASITTRNNGDIVLMKNGRGYKSDELIDDMLDVSEQSAGILKQIYGETNIPVSASYTLSKTPMNMAEFDKLMTDPDYLEINKHKIAHLALEGTLDRYITRRAEIASKKEQ